MSEIIRVDDYGEVTQQVNKPPALLPAQALGTLMSAGPELAKGLAAAIKACPGVEKTSTNTYHKYDYASADAIIEVGRKALAENGLVLLPIEASLNGSERDGPDRYELVRTFILLHESGQKVPLRVAWPVVPDKGRPLDKATAAADTLSLAYLLRDLLQMPRVDPGDDINARDDRHRQEQRSAPPRQQQPASQPAQQASKPTNGTSKPADEMPKTGAELRERMRRFEEDMVQKGLCVRGDLFKHIVHVVGGAGHGPDMTKWNAQAIAHAVHEAKGFRDRRKGGKPPARPVNPQLQAWIDKLKMTDAQVSDYCREFFNKNSLAELAEDEAGTMVADLADLFAQRKKESVGGFGEKHTDVQDEIPY